MHVWDSKKRDSNRDSKMRKAAGYRADGRDASSSEVPGSTGCGCPDDDQQGAGYFRSKTAESKDKGEDSDGDEQGGQMYLGQPAADFEELEQSFVGVDWNADHLTEN
jgi:hypothetical protein